MEHDPYTPPQAEVRDPRRDDLPLNKPKEVVRAVALLWVSLGINVVALLRSLLFTQSAASWSAGRIILVVFLGLLALIVVAISSGRNWARILYLVLFAFSALSWLFMPTAMFSRSVVAGSLIVAQIIVQAAAMYLLFTRPGSLWFGRRRK